jgi:hypothetical protein
MHMHMEEVCATGKEVPRKLEQGKARTMEREKPTGVCALGTFVRS